MLPCCDGENKVIYLNSHAIDEWP